MSWRGLPPSRSLQSTTGYGFMQLSWCCAKSSVRAAVSRQNQPRCGEANLQREGWSLTLGAPSGGGMQRPELGTREVRLPLPPVRLSQDSNIFSTYFTEGTGRLRYIPEASVDKSLVSIGGLSLRCGTIASSRVHRILLLYHCAPLVLPSPTCFICADRSAYRSCQQTTQADAIPHVGWNEDGFFLLVFHQDICKYGSMAMPVYTASPFGRSRREPRSRGGSGPLQEIYAMFLPLAGSVPYIQESI
jgi:hypothetical protein